MDTTGNEALREMLAAEYALGTLRGGARRRFEHWLRDDRELRALTFAWNERLAPLVDAVAPVAPPARLWTAIEARLPGGAAPRAANAWWNRLGLWRGLSAAFAVVAAVAMALAMRPAPSPEIRFVQVQAMPGAVATLTDPKTHAAVAMVMASASGDEMIVKLMSADARPAQGQALQLWSTPNGTELKSMGVLPAADADATIHLKTVDGVQLAAAKAIGLSLEPAGGSPQPTHVLGLGALVRLSG